MLRKLLKELDSIYLDTTLRKNIGGYTLDTNIIFDFLNGRHEVKGVRKIINEERVTVYFTVLEEISKILKYYKFRDLVKFLNRENMRLLRNNYENWRNIIEACDFVGDKDLLICSLEKNMSKNDAKILAQSIYENTILVTRDEKMKIIAGLYIPSNSKKKNNPYQRNWKEYLKNRIENEKNPIPIN
ncbi:MAG: PIN domain-containing protein [Candidatus Aenigmatarchaeota archaeon]